MTDFWARQPPNDAWVLFSIFSPPGGWGTGPTGPNQVFVSTAPNAGVWSSFVAGQPNGPLPAATAVGDVLTWDGSAWIALAGSRYPIKPSGGADDGPAIETAAAFAAATGKVLYLLPGTWTVHTPVALPNNLTVEFAPGVHIVGTATADINLANSLFLHWITYAPGITTLTAAPAVGSKTVDVASVTVPAITVGCEIAIGQWVGLRAQIFRVEKIVGLTLTLDRGTSEPFVNMAFVTVVTDRARNIRLLGNGATITGTCCRYIELQGAIDCYVGQLTISDDGGDSFDAAVSFDTCGLRSIFEDINVTHSLPEKTSPGIMVEISEECEVNRASVTGYGAGVQVTAGYRHKIQHVKLDSVWFGVQLTEDIDTGRGCYDVELSHISGTNVGMPVSLQCGSSGTKIQMGRFKLVSIYQLDLVKCTKTTIEDWQSDGGAVGMNCPVTTSDVRAENLVLTGLANQIVMAATGVRIKRITGSCAWGQMTYFDNTAGNDVQIEDFDFTSTCPTQIYGIDSGAGATGAVLFKRGTFHMHNGNDVVVPGRAARRMLFEDVTSTGAGFGVYFLATATRVEIRGYTKFAGTEYAGFVNGSDYMNIGNIALNGATAVHWYWPGIAAGAQYAVTRQSVVGAAGAFIAVIGTDELTITGTLGDTSAVRVWIN